MTELSNSDWIALASGFVALCALSVSIWQGYITRRHAVLSVKPHLDINVYTSTIDSCRVEIRNGGMGPAFITSIYVVKDGVQIKLSPDSGWAFLEKCLQKQIPKLRFQRVVPDPPAAIPAGETIQLLKLESPEFPKELGKTFNALMKTMPIIIKYECIYGNVFKSTSITLDL